MSHVKKLCICALCVALCSVLAKSFALLGLGPVFSPLHFPVLLCGVVCGWPWGLVCGVVGPLLSFLTVQAPPSAAKLIPMLPELAVYGFLSGLLMSFIRTGRRTVDLYLSLIPAMLLGRVVGGVTQTLLLLKDAQGYSVSQWAAAYLVTTAPGAAAHLILIPLLVLALERARVIPPRYPAALQKRQKKTPVR